MSESTELATTDAPKSLAAQQRARMDALITAVEAKSEQLGALLADSGIPFKKFVEVFRRALIQNPDLLKADAGSVIHACICAATDHLLPDGRQAAIVIYAGKAQYQPMVQGLMEIAYRTGLFMSIEARCVYEGDFFEYELGDEPFIKHRPKARPASGGPAPTIIASYAVAKTTNGGVFREVFEGADIQKVNAVSRSTKGPGKAWPEEFARKAPVRRMWKYLPKDDRMNRVVEHDNENYDLDQLSELPATPERKLRAGFAPPPAAIEHQEPEVVDTSIPEESEREGVLISEPADEAEKTPQEAPPTDEAPDAATNPFTAFLAKLEAAPGWLAIKQALKTLFKDPEGAEQRPRALAAAWARFEDLGDRTDWISDVVLFECWVVGADHDPDAVEGNWRIVQKDGAYAKLPAEEQERLAAAVKNAKGETE